MREYRYMSYAQRVMLAGMIEAGMAPRKIGRELGMDRATIYRELRRGWTECGYDPETAERRVRENMRRRGRKRCPPGQGGRRRGKDRKEETGDV